MANQFKTSITAHITKLRDFYKAESDYWENEMELAPRQKSPRENYLKYHWEYRAYDTLLANIEAGNYENEQYYKAYLNPLKK